MIKIVTGLSRSGTSYLAKKIDEQIHPMWRNKNNHCEELIIHNICKNLLAEYKDSLFGFNEVSDDKKQIFKKALSKFKRNNPTVGFKEPRLIFFINEVREIYPEAGIICLFRNFKDWRESHRKRGRHKAWDDLLRAHYNYCIGKLHNPVIDEVISYEYMADVKWIKTDDFKVKTYEK